MSLQQQNLVPLLTPESTAAVSENMVSVDTALFQHGMFKASYHDLIFFSWGIWWMSQPIEWSCQVYS